jgi:Methyltransferase small domain
MTSCQCQGIETQFDSREAAQKLAGCHKNGPAGTTRLLLAALKEAGVEGSTLLDIGGGIGVIQMELLKRRVSRAVNVEASTAYIEASQRVVRSVSPKSASRPSSDTASRSGMVSRDTRWATAPASEGSSAPPSAAALS